MSVAPDLRALLFDALLVVAQEGNGVRIEADDAHLVCLGVFDDRLAVLADEVAPDRQQPSGQVEVFPGEAEQLAASRSGDESQPDESAPIGVLLPRCTHDPGRLIGRRRIRLRVLLSRALDRLQRVDCDPAPPHRRLSAPLSTA
ncbi:MAG: hypothetical protein ACRDSL_03520 [Pseudonocardiaceae bacterium]